MSDFDKIVLGAVVAVAVYVAGQLLSKFFIEPVYELKKVLGEVRFSLAFHAPTIHTPIGRTLERSDAAYDAIMKNSSDIIAKLQAVPFYELTCFLALGALPTRKSLEEASVKLRGLSTYLHEIGDEAIRSIDEINKRVDKIERLLCLTPLDE